MSGLIPFHEIDIYGDNEQWDDDNNYIGPYTTEQIAAAEFLQKMDYEGGIDGLMGYGGPSYFPEAVQAEAEAYYKAERALHKAVMDWAAERGISY